MAHTLWAATEDGVIRFARSDDGWTQAEYSLTGHDVTCIAAQGACLLAGTLSGVFRSEDGGTTWQESSRGLTRSHLRWLEFHPEVQGLALAGTEPAAIFHTEDSGLNWRESPEITHLQQAGRWFLPYSPESGCIRGLAFHGERAYAAAEVGGALRSDDSGRTWRLTEGSQGVAEFSRPPEPFIHPDVHSVVTHPSSADRVYAPTGDGFYLTRDGGKTWRMRYDAYCRAVWVDPGDPNHLLLGPADDVDTNGRIEETLDGGTTWHMASEGVRTPWRNHMVERFRQVDGEVLAVLSNGKVLASPLTAISWRPVFPGLRPVRALTDL